MLCCVVLCLRLRLIWCTSMLYVGGWTCLIDRRFFCFSIVHTACRWCSMVYVVSFDLCTSTVLHIFSNLNQKDCKIFARQWFVMWRVVLVFVFWNCWTGYGPVHLENCCMRGLMVIMMCFSYSIGLSLAAQLPPSTRRKLERFLHAAATLYL